MICLHMGYHVYLKKGYFPVVVFLVFFFLVFAVVVVVFLVNMLIYYLKIMCISTGSTLKVETNQLASFS